MSEEISPSSQKVTEAPAPEGTSPEVTKAEDIQDDRVDYAHFAKMDLRVAQIVEAERLTKSEKLVKLQINLGDLGPRQIVAGVGKHYSPEQLIGRKIVVVANLKPAKLMGEVSNGMLLAITDSLGFLELITPSPESPLGGKVS